MTGGHRRAVSTSPKRMQMLMNVPNSLKTGIGKSTKDMKLMAVANVVAEHAESDCLYMSCIRNSDRSYLVFFCLAFGDSRAKVQASVKTKI